MARRGRLFPTFTGPGWTGSSWKPTLAKAIDAASWVIQVQFFKSRLDAEGWRALQIASESVSMPLMRGTVKSLRKTCGIRSWSDVVDQQKERCKPHRRRLTKSGAGRMKTSYEGRRLVVQALLGLRRGRGSRARRFKVNGVPLSTTSGKEGKASPKQNTIDEEDGPRVC